MGCPIGAILLLVVPIAVHSLAHRPTWGIQVVLNGDGYLDCNDSDVMLHPGDVVQWETPNGKQINRDSNYVDTKYELIDKNLVNGMVLGIKSVRESDHGVYICYVTRYGVQVTRNLRALNLHKPAYTNTIARYGDRLAIAFIATNVFLFPVVGGCLLYEWKTLNK